MDKPHVWSTVQYIFIYIQYIFIYIQYIFTEQLIEQSAVEHGSNLSKYYNLPDILCQLELARNYFVKLEYTRNAKFVFPPIFRQITNVIFREYFCEKQTHNFDPTPVTTSQYDLQQLHNGVRQPLAIWNPTIGLWPDFQ